MPAMVFNLGRYLGPSLLTFDIFSFLISHQDALIDSIRIDSILRCSFDSIRFDSIHWREFFGPSVLEQLRVDRHAWRRSEAGRRELV